MSEERKRSGPERYIPPCKNTWSTPARSEAAGGEDCGVRVTSNVVPLITALQAAVRRGNANGEDVARRKLEDYIASLRQQLAAAREDGARLDWLEDFVRATVERTYGGDVAFYGSTDGPALYLGSDNEAHRGATVREAIDRARAEAGSGEVGNGRA